MLRCVIVYDIIDNKRRKKVSDLLEKHGDRVNKSVFECIFKNKEQLNMMILELTETINRKKDSVRIYNICKNCILDSHLLGKNEPEPFEMKDVFFVS